MDQLATAPGAEIVFEAVAGEERRLRRRRRGPRRPARPHAEGARPRRRGRRDRRRPPRGRAHRRHAARPRALRHGDDQRRRVRVRPRERPQGDLPAPRRAAGGRARRDDRARTSPAATSRSTRSPSTLDGERRDRVARGARRTSQTGVLRVLHERSFRRRPDADAAAASATPRGWRFNTAPGHAHADRPAADRHGHRRPARQRAAAARPRAARRAAPARAHRPRREAARQRLPGASTTASSGPLGARRVLHARSRASELTQRLDHLGFRASERHVIVAAATAFERLHTHLDVPDAELWRLLRRERPETAELLAAAGNDGRAALARRRPPPPARHHRRGPDRRRA